MCLNQYCFHIKMIAVHINYNNGELKNEFRGNTS